ncbi:YybH family protein [Xanthomonas campestris]|uniref:YybH family protein n=1 Tax=Xanthomonas campestris TaxID=339 RepID=UPI00389083F1
MKLGITSETNPMNTRVLNSLSLTLLIALPAVSLAHKGEPHATAPASTAISEQAAPAVLVVQQFSAALRSGDLERAGALLADDVLVLESGGAERSRDEYLGGHAAHDAAFLKTVHTEVKAQTARSDGNLAWVATESELHTNKEGKPVTLLSSETMVLKQTSQGWRISHIHWSTKTQR